MSVRWTCPTCSGTVLGPERPRRDDVRRYCLDCSKRSGKLVPRVAPSLERARAAREARRRERDRAVTERVRARRDAYYTVDGINLRDAMIEMLRMDVFDGPAARALRANPPDLIVSRRTTIHTRLGVAQIRKHRIRVNVTSETRAPRALGTLLHEIVHFVVGRRPDGWHGSLFKSTLASAHEEWSSRRPRVRAGGVVIDLPEAGDDRGHEREASPSAQPAHA